MSIKTCSVTDDGMRDNNVLDDDGDVETGGDSGAAHEDDEMMTGPVIQRWLMLDP